MIIVIGPGFVGTNALTKLLMDEGYFMGRWFLPSTPQHPYPIYEDREWALAIRYAEKCVENTRDYNLFLVYTTALIKHREAISYGGGPKWGFKAPNTWLYLPQLNDLTAFHNLKPRFLCGERDTDTLISRMKYRWNYTEDQALARIIRYRKVVDALKDKLVVEQQEFLNEREVVKKRILEWL